MSIFSNRASAAKGEAEAYTAAVLELLGSQDPIVVLQRTPDEIARTIAERAHQELRRAEAPGKWSAVQVIQHLADSDLVWGYRMRQVLAEDRPRLTGYDQDLWASRLRYQDVDPAQALESFTLLRELNLRLLDGLDDSALGRAGVHSERGEERLDHMVSLYAGHDLVHLRQLARIFEAAATSES